ncbi:MAG TPA: class II fructose-bisphosphatase [Methyloceanibacter sp.]|nr:class II fructose-bisphosphatase [Methyloceanibacter sp.]
MQSPDPVNPDLVYSLRRVTERAACAAFNWIGRGDADDGGRAALEAMRSALGEIDIDARVVIGEATAGEAPQPQRGEHLGHPGAAFKADIAVDPVEGTSYLVRGLTNALSVLALAPRGAMMNPGPAFYMEKFVASAAARGKIDPTWSTAKKLEELAEILNKDISDLTVFVLEKPRHRNLVSEILAAGSRVAMYPAGDVAGALMAAVPGSGIDALMGTGGTPEGVMSACAIRAIGGEFLARLDPQLQTETKAVKDAGIDTARWFERDELITSDDLFFCATGITTGLMLEGVERSKSHYKVQTMMITGATGERQIMTSYVPTDRLASVAARDVA